MDYKETLAVKKISLTSLIIILKSWLS